MMLRGDGMSRLVGMGRPHVGQHSNRIVGAQSRPRVEADNVQPKDGFFDVWGHWCFEAWLDKH